MAKYIGTYATSGDVQTALNNQELSRPFIAYTTDNDKVYYGPAADRAEVGDIVVYSVSDDLLHYIKQADYNTTSYPSASYAPVGVVTMSQTDDIISGPAGEITFIGLNWLSRNNPDTGDNTSKSKNVSWGYDNYAIPELTNYSNSGTAITDMNGKANTEAVLNYATAQTDWKTASAITWTNAAGYYPLFECAWRYHTSGTSQGDWYVPACGQLYSIKDDGKLSVINNSLSLTGGNQIVFDNSNIDIFTSTQYNASMAFHNSGNFNSLEARQKYFEQYARPFCTKLMTRI